MLFALLDLFWGINVASRGVFLDGVVLGLRLGWGCELSIIIILLATVLKNGIVGDTSFRCICRCFAGEESRSFPEVGKLKGIILLDYFAVDVWDEEQRGEKEKTESNTKSD